MNKIENLKRLIAIYQEERNYPKADALRHELKLAIKEQKARHTIIK